jgi:hypothetical protein
MASPATNKNGTLIYRYRFARASKLEDLGLGCRQLGPFAFEFALVISVGDIMVLELRLGDVVRLKKAHPCGSLEWAVVRLGADIGIKCLKCQHQVMLERVVLERRIKAFVKRGEVQKDSYASPPPDSSSPDRCRGVIEGLQIDKKGNDRSHGD